jgi:hypothetical protein
VSSQEAFAKTVTTTAEAGLTTNHLVVLAERLSGELDQKTTAFGYPGAPMPEDPRWIDQDQS